MRFAFAGIDFLGDVFHTLIESGWEPVKLFSRPCDGIYDFNEATLARARILRSPSPSVKPSGRPAPSSSSVSLIPLAICSSRSQRLLAPACLSALWTASCATR